MNVEKTFQILEQECNVFIVKRRVLKANRYSMIVSLTVLLRRLGFVRNVLDYVPESVLTIETICFRIIPISLNLTYGLSSPLKPVHTCTGFVNEEEF